MSQDDALFRRMLDNDPASHNANAGKNETEESVSFPTGSNVRNISFVWPDGRKLFLNYSYLVSGEYSPDQAAIVLAFTTHNHAERRTAGVVIRRSAGPYSEGHQLHGCAV